MASAEALNLFGVDGRDGLDVDGKAPKTMVILLLVPFKQMSLTKNWE